MIPEAISLMEQALTTIGPDAEQDRLRISHSLGRAHGERADGYLSNQNLQADEKFNGNDCLLYLFFFYFKF